MEQITKGYHSREYSQNVPASFFLFNLAQAEGSKAKSACPRKNIYRERNQIVRQRKHLKTANIVAAKRQI